MRFIILLSALFFLAIPLNGQVTFVIHHSKSAGIHKHDSIYLASDLNGWIPNDDRFLFTTKEGQLTLTIPIDISKPFYYKLTKGSWPTVEKSELSDDIPNRTYTPSILPDTIILISFFTEKISYKKTISTKSPHVTILEDTIATPYLDTKKTLRIYLPPDYHTTDKKYPVIYMTDGQNIFDTSTAYSSEWRIDEIMDSLYQVHQWSCIIVGIDHAHSDRLAEYAPYKTIYHPKTWGKQFDQWLHNTLIPFIETHYRTSDSSSKNIIGSSMGGLIVTYILLNHPNEWQTIGILSPSYWISDMIFNLSEVTAECNKCTIYLYTGDNESDLQVPNTIKMYQNLLEHLSGQEEVKLEIAKGEGHNEKAWSNAFLSFIDMVRNKSK